ncbi:thioesterase II family protein [Kitasatospora aburaviensis]
MHKLSDEELFGRVAALGGTDQRVLDDPELRALVLPSLRADHAAIETYRCGPDAVVPQPITALTGDADPRASLEEVQDWAGHTTGGFEMRVFPGGHFYLAEQRRAVLDVLVEHLEGWRGARPVGGRSGPRPAGSGGVRPWRSVHAQWRSVRKRGG